jgi:hypothetical protein
VEIRTGILEGGADAPSSEGMDRLARGRGRKNVVQNGEPFGVEGGVDGIALGTGIFFDFAKECEYE